MITCKDFSVGDRVRHAGGSEGIVSVVNQTGVHVKFDNSRMVGIYDDLWFQLHEGWLVKTTELKTEARKDG